MLPDSAVRSVSIVLMITHQCIAFGMFIMPVHHMWEKLIRTHDKPFWIRLPSHLPVGELLKTLCHIYQSVLSQQVPRGNCLFNLVIVTPPLFSVAWPLSNTLYPHGCVQEDV